MQLGDGYKFIPGHENYYSINRNGEIWGYRSQKFIIPAANRAGYPVIWLQGRTRKERKHYYVHRLVALTFIPNPNNKPEVNHIDGNKQNNHVSNLEWVTHQENMQHAHDCGLYDESLYFRDWINWNPEQLAEFEQSPYNTPVSGAYEYPADLKTKINQISAMESATNEPMAVNF